jgi:L-asparaginase II
MARAYANLAGPSMLEPARREACRRIVRAMQEHPEMTNEPDWRPACGKKLVTKGGAAGLYCGGAVGKGVGFAMKAAAGSSLPLVPVFLAVMERRRVLDRDEAERARKLRPPELKNRRGEIVGTLEISDEVER